MRQQHNLISCTVAASRPRRSRDAMLKLVEFQHLWKDPRRFRDQLRTRSSRLEPGDEVDRLDCPLSSNRRV